MKITLDKSNDCLRIEFINEKKMSLYETFWTISGAQLNGPSILYGSLIGSFELPVPLVLELEGISKLTDINNCFINDIQYKIG